MRLRHLVLGFVMKNPGLTADEIAERLGIDRLAIRPRCSELRKRNLIEPTGERKPNASGASAHCWRATVIGELAKATERLF
jgi:predicted ArsR family transcriptional regulator